VTDPPSEQPDPDKALAKSLRAVVRAEVQRTDPDELDKPKRPTLAQVATLAVLALDATLIYMLAESQLRFSESALLAAAKTVVPAIGGVAFVAYLETIRDALISLCKHWQTKVAAIAVGVVLLVATVAPLPLNISVSPRSQVTVDGIGSEPLKPNQTSQVVHVRGFGPHQLIVSEQVVGDVPLVDTIDIGALDMFRSLRSGDSIAASSPYIISAARRVSAFQRDTTRYLVVSGKFPDLYLRRMRHLAWVEDADPANVSVWIPLSEKSGYGRPVPVPEGVFTFRLVPQMCETPSKIDTVTSRMLMINICQTRDLAKREKDKP
jgi:hypothetical protein